MRRWTDATFYLRLLLAAALLNLNAPLRADEGDVEVTDEVSFDSGARLRHAYPMALDEGRRTLYVGGYDSHNLLAWDLNHRVVLAEATGIRHPHTLRFDAATERVFALGYDDNNQAVLVVYNAALQEQRRVTLGSYSYSMVLAPDHETMYVGLFGSVVTVNVNTGALATFASLPTYYFAFALSFDEPRNRLAVTGMGWMQAGGNWVLRSAVQTFSLSNGAPVNTLVLGDGLFSLDSLRDGDTLYVANTDANSLSIVDLTDLTLLGEIPGVSCPQRMVLHPTRRKLFVIDNYLDRFHVINIDTRLVEKTVYPGDDPSSLLFSSDGKCYMANYWSNDVTVIDGETGDILERIPLAAAAPQNLYFDGQGHRLYITNGSSNGIFVYDTNTGSLIDQLTMPDGAFGGPILVKGSKVFVVDPWRNGIGVYPKNSHDNSYQASHMELNFIPLSGTHPSGIAEGASNTLVVPFIKGAALTLAVVNMSHETVTDEISLGTSLQGGEVGVNQQKKRAYVADYANAKVISVDLKNNRMLNEVSVERQPTGLAVHPDTGRIYVSNAGADSVAVVEDDPLENLGFIDVGDEPSSIAFAPSKARIYVLNRTDGTMSVINELTHAVVETVPVAQGARALVVDHDDIYVASPDMGQLILVRDNFQALSLTGASNSAFMMREAYGYPNPARNANPIVHVEVGVADAVQLSFYDLSGQLVHQTVLSDGPRVFGGEYIYEYTWNVEGVAPGVYLVDVLAKKAGQSDLRKSMKLAVLK